MHGARAMTIKDSINFTNQFKKLEDSLSGPDYVVHLEAIYFSYISLKNFGLEELKNVYNIKNSKLKKIDGEIITSNYEDVRKSILMGLSFVSDMSSRGFSNEKYITIPRETAYWKHVYNFFPYTPSHVYRHIPYLNTYFGSYVMWQFTFILLYEGHGVVLSGQSWD